jgi:DNA polymerase-3 subunit gamma/tau
MPEYQVLARKYRPQSFGEIIGQDAIVSTLKNAIKNQRLAHAYLFCGSRGTGKTTLARVLAKALNCIQPTADLEPCNECSSCKEIATGSSLDVLEIDGASHRGIDDVRQINETVGYAASAGKYKIYIIDEVHMLTKEAFNALLKTLEEPPPKVKFFFATTEPHKVLPTILSRCQRFNLNRIPTEKIIDKLQSICQDLGIPVQEEALRLLANRAEGGLRDAESLLDQVIAFHEGEITSATIASMLGVMPQEILFDLDRAGKEGHFAVAFEIANAIFSEGKDLMHFIEMLTEHFRNILLVKLSGKNASFLSFSKNAREQYEASSKLYSQEQCMTILDFLIEAQNQMRFMPSAKIALEALLLRIMRTHHRVPTDFLVRRLIELEQNVKGGTAATPLPTQITKTPSPPSSIDPKAHSSSSISEDPTPTPADLGLKAQKPKDSTKIETLTVEPPKWQSRYDTILQFAAVELEGKIQRKQLNG